MLNDCYFQVNPTKTSLEIIQLANKYTQKNINYNFNLKDTKQVKIGRDKTNDICLDWDRTYSKRQCVLQWDEFLDQWKITDGGGINNGSRNGSWVFASRSFEIYDGTIFRVANSKIKINIGT